jgi:hypothetical protein
LKLNKHGPFFEDAGDADAGAGDGARPTPRPRDFTERAP